MLITILQILGGGLIGALLPIFYIRHIRSQQKGIGVQEEAKGKQEEIKALESMDSVLDRISARVDKEVAKYQATISQQEVLIEKQAGEIKQLKKIVETTKDELRKATEKMENYINQCERCPNKK